MLRTTLAVSAIMSYPFMALAQGVTAPPPPPPPWTEEQVLVPGQNVVIVSGNAAVEVAPDTLSVNFGVETEGKDIRAIVAENNKKFAALMKSLQSFDLTTSELRTSHFRLSSSPFEREAVDTVYAVSNELGITRHDTHQAESLVQAAIDAGATSVSDLQFSVADEKAVQDQCMEVAFKDAERKAQNLARLSKRALGRVVAVTDGSSSPFELRHRSGVEGGVPGGFMFQPGARRVECGVTVAFQLN
jgi:uncharacterized protein